MRQGLIDPLADLEITVHHFDIERLMSVYPDNAGLRWWTKAWYNHSKFGEPSVEIELAEALHFLLDHPSKDEWLDKYFPKPQEIYRNAMQRTKEQLVAQATVANK